MIKQNQFYVYKLKSSRLYEDKYDIKLDLEQARKYKELIQLGDNQILKSLRLSKNQDIDFKYIAKLKKEKKSLSKEDSEENRKRIKQIQNELDKLLFVPEYVAVVINKLKEYDRIYKLGFKINDKKYKRFSCSSSQGRVNTVIFIQEEYSDKLKDILVNGLDQSVKLVPNKFNAYFGLNSSCIYEVNTPRVCVIPDKEVKMVKKVEFIDDTDNIDISEREVVANLWDGQGLISPKMSKEWARKNLEIYDYTPSYYIVRSNWIKGALFTFDFHKFAEEIAKKDEIIDIYGETHKISDIDIILSESQFKMHKNYSSWEDFTKKCEDNKLVWGVSRVAPKEVNNYTTTNYQFIQTLKLDDSDIEGLLEPTINWIDGVLNNNPIYTMLFINGSFNNQDDALESLKYTSNSYVKALMYNPNMMNDIYIKKKVKDLINKKIKEAMLGKFLISGNYQIMCSDPYAMAEHAFKLEDIKGLLNEFEHYSDYWNNKEVSTVDAMRSPLTWKSEHNILHLQNEAIQNEWYQYLQGCIIYNVWGTDCMRHADGDFDGDLVCTTNNKYFIKGSDESLLPITYNKNIAEKVVIKNDDILIKSDKQSFNSKIGQITNVSTKFYAMLPLFDENSIEYKEIIKRLKLLRKEQGNEIDRAKGVQVKPFNNEWVMFNRILDTDSDDVKAKKEFNNSIVADKKPYFMIYLYSTLNREYSKFISNCDTYSQIKFGISIDELKNKKNKHTDEIEYLKYFNKHMPVNLSDCVTNKLCWYVEKVNKEKFKVKHDKGSPETIMLMIDDEISFNEKIYNKVKKTYQEYNSYKYNDLQINEYEISPTEYTDEKQDYNYFNNINEFFRRKLSAICSNDKELANYAVRLCYIENNPVNKDFAWKVCEDGLLENIKKNSGNKLYIPVVDEENGGIEYLGQRYTLEEVVDVQNI